MISQLKDKKVIFFDVGFTLDRPASGDWMFTKKFLAEAGDALKPYGNEEIRRAYEPALRFLEENHLVLTVEEEAEQFYRFYSIFCGELGLGLSEAQLRQVARDRACNMENYVPYPGIKEVLETLGRTHRLGIISDTWPSIRPQLEHIGVARYFSFATFSFTLGVFKPDPRMFEDALAKAGVPAEETVFIDDSVRNLEGAAALGIFPILIAANPASDVETSFLKIHDLRELIR